MVECNGSFKIISPDFSHVVPKNGITFTFFLLTLILVFKICFQRLHTHCSFIPRDVYDLVYVPESDELEAIIGMNSTVSFNSTSYAIASMLRYSF
jgi:hypothetical protein